MTFNFQKCINIVALVIKKENTLYWIEVDFIGIMIQVEKKVKTKTSYNTGSEYTKNLIRIQESL